MSLLCLFSVGVKAKEALTDLLPSIKSSNRYTMLEKMIWGTVSVNSSVSHRVMSFVKGSKDVFSHCLKATATTCEKFVPFYPILSKSLQSSEES